MDLRRATTLLIFGLLYGVLHKAAYALFPALGASPVGRTVTAVLWLLGAAAIVLFACRFLRELAPRDGRLRYALVAIIVFTAMLVVAKLPLWPGPGGRAAARLLFSAGRLGNALAAFVFLTALSGVVAAGSPLGTPLRLSIRAVGLSVVLGAVPFAAALVSRLIGREIPSLARLQPLAVLSFLFTYGSVIWFLIRFRDLEDHRALAGEIPVGTDSPLHVRGRTHP